MAQSPADPHLTAGERHLDTGAWEEAEAAFRRAVEAAPTSAVAHSKLGVALANQRRLQEAEQAFARAVTLDPRYAPAWSNLGNVYRETGRSEEALQAYERAVAADPDYWIAHQNLGALYKQMGRTSEAIASFKRATRLQLKAPIRRSAGGPAPRIGCLGRTAVLLVALAALGAALLALRA
ncbi:MAG: tetratricopeptide repeat protein [Armatimonadota bacterium]|nr:tetratricopeptide repeat protein [Armatimonadota bacterium]MDR7421023.1 tetratricopeptide repeat protein [Armatimonadota bacterium]MDR7453277.1 tetratricopeptide repeat protein [Armatimonadota bacterium]MDR7457397.1 tetratricopeptide repeat protein [Armatimonadota bacterium]MDR7497505.1 tetratricopeptide repeat protein [Armatimonadota bacterium]